MGDEATALFCGSLTDGSHAMHPVAVSGSHVDQANPHELVQSLAVHAMRQGCRSGVRGVRREQEPEPRSEATVVVVDGRELRIVDDPVIDPHIGVLGSTHLVLLPRYATAPSPV